MQESPRSWAKRMLLFFSVAECSQHAQPHSSMKFIHAADLHLDSPLRGLQRYEGAPVQELRAATRGALCELVSLALEERVAFVLFSGDLYDGDWTDYNTGLFFGQQMARLQDASIPVFVISGNHDAQSRMTRSLRLPTNVRVFSTRQPETITLDDLGVAVHGQGFDRPAVTGNLSTSYPARIAGLLNIGMLHTAMDGRDGHASYAPCTVADLCAREYDYWALGHVHRREVVRSGDPWIVFPGNLQGRNARETGRKGCYLVSVDGEQITDLEERRLDRVSWSTCEVDASRALDMDSVLERCREQLIACMSEADNRLVAVRVNISGRTLAHPQLVGDLVRNTAEIRSLADEIGAGAIWVEKVRISSSILDPDAEGVGSEDAVAYIREAVRSDGQDEAAVNEMLLELRDLWTRLPEELRSGTEPLGTDQAEWVRSILPDAEALLLDRLTNRPRPGGSI